MDTIPQFIVDVVARASSDNERACILTKYAEDMLNPNVHLSQILAEKARLLAIEHSFTEETAHATNILGGCAYRLSEYDLAIEYSKTALQLSQEAGYDYGIAFAHNTIGAVSINTGDLSYALESFLKSLAIREKIDHQQGVATSLMNIGNVYQALGDHSKALEYFMKSLTLREKIGDKSGVGTSLTNIGGCYAILGDYDTALDYFLQSLEIKQEIGNRQGMIFTLISISEAYLAVDNTKQSIDYAERSYTLSREMNNKLGQSIALHCIGLALEKAGELHDALECIHRSLSMHLDIHNPSGEAESLLAIGRLAMKLGTIDIALENFHRALVIAEHIQHKMLIIKVNYELAELYRKVGDYTKAYKYFDDFFKLKEETLGDESRRSMKNLQVIYQVEQAKKEADIYRIRNNELAELNHQLTELNIEKNEFLGIAAHDLKNPLSSIMLTASKVKNHFQKMTADEVIAQMHSIEKTAERMRKIISNFLDIYSIESGTINLTFQTFDISSAVRSIIDDFKQKALVKNITLELINADEAIYVYANYNSTVEIVENLVSNSIKFCSSGNTVRILLSALPAQSVARIEVADDGNGLTEEDKLKLFGKFARLSARPTASEDSTGLGLFIAKKLVESMNGKIWCDSTYGKGAKFFVELPKQ